MIAMPVVVGKEPGVWYANREFPFVAGPATKLRRPLSPAWLTEAEAEIGTAGAADATAVSWFRKRADFGRVSGVR
jgi:hypothetical protein